MYHVEIKRAIDAPLTNWWVGEFGRQRHLGDDLSGRQVECLESVQCLSALLAGLAVQGNVFDDFSWMMDNLYEDLDDDCPEEMIEDLFRALDVLSKALERNGSAIVRCSETGAIFGAVAGGDVDKTADILGGSINELSQQTYLLICGDQYKKREVRK